MGKRGLKMLAAGIFFASVAAGAQDAPEDDRTRRIRESYQQALITEDPDKARAAEVVARAKADAAREAAQAAEAKRQRDRVAAMKAKCGTDYNRSQVGMSFTRVKECSTGKYLLKLEQLTPDGDVLRGYQKGNLFLHVVADKVVRAVVL